MTAILTFTIICALVYLYIFNLSNSENFNTKKILTSKYTRLTILLALVVRIVLAISYRGHETDISCFDGWSTQIFEGGISAFYKSEGFHDYPPGYMYVLYIVGFLKSIMNLDQQATWLLLKFPAIICDILSGLLIYSFTNRHQSRTIHSVFAMGIYLFNPAIILNSSLWGQVDSVYTLFVAIFLCLLSQRQLIASYFAFAICIFIKPQAFMFLPLIAFAIFENIFLPKFDVQKFFKNIVCGAFAITFIVLLSIPFGLSNVINQYIQTLNSYQYFTVNAFNFWGALGLNWTPLTTFASVLGYIMLIIIVIYSGYVFFTSKNDSKYLYLGGLISFMTFMLSTKMHDRYAFPAMLLMLMAYAMTKKRTVFLSYTLITLSQFFNTAWVLFLYEKDINYYCNSPIIIIASIINIAIMLFICGFIHKDFSENTFSKNKKRSDFSQSYNVKKTATHKKFSKYDYIFITSIMIIYSFVAFYRLGDFVAPQNGINISPNSNITIDLGEEKEISLFKAYLGPYNLDDSRILNIACYNDAIELVSEQNQSEGNVFYWNEFYIPEEYKSNKTRYITMTSNNQKLIVEELAIILSDGSTAVPVNCQDATIKALFDEKDTVPQRTTFMNSTYFDEIYHARTAYEYLNGLDVYEWTHPPLGKAIMSLGIKIFGMTPFGWRFMGTLFGILMIPLIYIFALMLCKKRFFASITCIIFTFDFMHFVQTRIATIDVYVTFFILLMYLFMYKYYTMSFYDSSLKKTFLPLGLCGITMGLAIASKWSGAYGAVGLAILFFSTLAKRYKEYKFAKSNPQGSTNNISHKHIIDSFRPNTIYTIIFCIGFFLIVPAIIYFLSYIPYMNSYGEGIGSIIKNQMDMFVYHSDTVVESTHPFSSKWYEWIIVKRPIFYYSSKVSEVVGEGISSFGNPLLWWSGIPAFIYLTYHLIKTKDKTAIYILIGYLSQLVFWIPITRTTYIYHYFPSVPFVAMMVGYSIYLIYNKIQNKTIVLSATLLYVALSIGLFVLFYPVLSGAPCYIEFAHIWLKWFDSWVLL